MDKIFIGIPILNRADLLRRGLLAIDYSAEIFIVNNSRDPVFRSEVELVAREKQATVLHQARNLGVAASWNLLIRTALSRGFEWVFIGSNDTELSSGSLKAAVEYEKGEAFGVWHLHAFNFFLIRERTIELVGWFDENFYPAYKEDQDYSYRCRLAGVRRLAGIPGCHAVHDGSATIRSNPLYARRNRITHARNTDYYRKKWGGDAGAEKFRSPCNSKEHDHRWWPVPNTPLQDGDWEIPALRSRRRIVHAEAASET